SPEPRLHEENPGTSAAPGLWRYLLKQFDGRLRVSVLLIDQLQLLVANGNLEGERSDNERAGRDLARTQTVVATSEDRHRVPHAGGVLQFEVEGVERDGLGATVVVAHRNRHVVGTGLRREVLLRRLVLDPHYGQPP